MKVNLKKNKGSDKSKYKKTIEPPKAQSGLFFYTPVEATKFSDGRLYVVVQVLLISISRELLVTMHPIRYRVFQDLSFAAHIR